MHDHLLNLLRCPFCGTRPALLDNDALKRTDDRVESGVLGCACCAFPIVAGIPVMVADEETTRAMHALEAGHGEAALFGLLGLDGARADAFRVLLGTGPQATYQQAIEILSPDAEGTYFVYRFTDPTYLLAQALLEALGQERRLLAGPVLDLCGGSGHLTRVLTRVQPAQGAVVADRAFWKLWLATRFTAPGCAAVCCDANQPLPFPRDAFSMSVLSDAFSYIWQKRLVAEEMMRVTGREGAVVVPHVHNALGENMSAGLPLEPGAYRDLLAPRDPRLFSDATLLTQILDTGSLDLGASVSPGALGREPSLTLIAAGDPGLFRAYTLPGALPVQGELRVNPLYRVDRRGAISELTLTFPTAEYEEEFGACRRYLPATVTVHADLTAPIVPEAIGPEANDLRRRRVLIDLPLRYC